MSGLYLYSFLAALLGAVAMVSAVARFVVTKLRATPLEAAEPPDVTWSSPTILFAISLLLLVAAGILWFVAFWKECTGGPDLC
jgi:hypothetical protein